MRHALIALPLLAACAAPQGVSLVYSQNITHDYRANAAYAFGAAVPLNVIGDAPDGSGAAAAAALMRLPARYGATPFEAVEDASGLRFVLAYAPASPAALCAGRVTGALDPLKGAIAFCNGSTPLSGARFQNSALRGPGSPGFDRTMLQALTAILPANNPNFKRRPGRD